MPLIIPPGFAQVTVPLRHTSVIREAVVTFGVDSSAYDGDYVNLANDISREFDDSIGSQLDNGVTIGPVRLSVGQDGGENLSVVGSAAYGGALSQESMPPNVAVLCRKTTARGGRRGRGRFFLPWCASDGDVSDAGILGASKKTALDGQLETFRLTLKGTALGMTFPAPMFILHSSEGSTAGSPNEVTNLVCDQLVATQRRRLGR